MPSVRSSWHSYHGRLRWAIGAGLTVGVLCVATGIWWPKKYSSTAILVFVPYGSIAYDDPQIPPHFDAWRKNTLTPSFLGSLRDRYNLFPGVPIAERDEQLRQAIRFQFRAQKGPLGQPRYGMEIGFVADTPQIAQRVASDIVGQTLSNNYAYNYEHFPHCVAPCRGDCTCASQFELEDVPSIPSTPDAPKIEHFLGLGLGLALTVGMVVLLI